MQCHVFQQMRCLHVKVNPINRVLVSTGLGTGHKTEVAPALNWLSFYWCEWICQNPDHGKIWKNEAIQVVRSNLPWAFPLQGAKFCITAVMKACGKNRPGSQQPEGDWMTCKPRQLQGCTSLFASCDDRVHNRHIHLQLVWQFISTLAQSYVPSTATWVSSPISFLASFVPLVEEGNPIIQVLANETLRTFSSSAWHHKCSLYHAVRGFRDRKPTPAQPGARHQCEKLQFFPGRRPGRSLY